ncbi:nitroreductase family protein [Alkalihalobacillus trypoxylicola]|uniref:Nitroreductase domain-containing protein n=1 Tax=Alkalihalobacillus trypoxylicola TaxID=519424 RepID=A0A162EUD4_9BACI|nr:nitroreductase family protein [Alkalihalobacillus trypoxylicola]KYG33746.1 hypothetical protein AZF04_16120 [Alkalihalobacillus trypoxylicola]
MTKEILELMSDIVNVRNYKEKEIPKETLENMYEGFRCGPASISTQARELVIIENKSSSQALVEATLNPYLTKDSYGAQKWIITAPFVSVVIIEMRRAIARVGESGLSFAMQESEASIQNMRLIAKSEGLVTATIREFDGEKLKKNLNLPWYVIPVAIVTAGYPMEEESENTPKLEMMEVVSKNRWT